MIDPVLGYIVTLSLAVLLGAAGVHKLRVRPEFSEALTAYRLIPASLVPAALCLLPAAELSTAFGLIVPAFRAAACVAAAILLLLYGCAIGVNLVRGRRDLDCGCSLASGRRPIATWMPWRNAVLASMALTTTLSWSTRPLTGIDGMTILAGTLAAVLLYACIETLFGRVSPATARAVMR